MPNITNPRHRRYRTVRGAYARNLPILPLCFFAQCRAAGSHMHKASFITSAGCIVNTPRLPIQPALPLTSTPSGVNVSSCSSIANNTTAKLKRLYIRAGRHMKTTPTTRPITQYMPWLMACENGDRPAETIDTVELENTMITPKPVSTTTAARKP